MQLDFDLIINATNLLVNQVKGSLDKQLLEKEMFEPNLKEDNLIFVVFSAIEILKL